VRSRVRSHRVTVEWDVLARSLVLLAAVAATANPPFGGCRKTRSSINSATERSSRIIVDSAQKGSPVACVLGLRLQGNHTTTGVQRENDQYPARLLHCRSRWIDRLGRRRTCAERHAPGWGGKRGPRGGRCDSAEALRDHPVGPDQHHRHEPGDPPPAIPMRIIRSPGPWPPE